MEQSTKQELTPFQIAVLVLSVFVLSVLTVELFVDVDPEIDRLTTWIDHAVCLVLFVDFSIRFRQAESKLAFMRWGWIDLLATIPVIDALRWGRTLRVLRVLRVVRSVQTLRAFFAIVFERRATGGVVTVTTVAFLTVSLASLAILTVEPREIANITTAEDALWWSLATVTTVGYGDVYPVTAAGRVIAAMLMLVGVGLFGTLSGTVASVFLGAGGAKEDAMLDELRALRAEVATLREARNEGESGEKQREAG